ncbi:hypothetical protein PG985_006130 [Apiospora marii]|uniref:uncharacterized protein n=1 Tax=Apiospora marii TaxID=335849 RepID=UPI00312E1B07
MEKKKLLYQLDTPYSASSWPEIPTDDQDAILELLCNFLSPLGNFRRHHTPTSKGKRIKKRKRHVTDSTENGSMNPEAPAIRQYVDIGLTTVTRGLQKPSTTSHDTTESFRQYSVIFVARSGQPSGINSHLPQMVAAASGLRPLQSPIRLVGFSKSCEQRLTSALGIPRVSCIGVTGDAPNSKALIDFVQKRVPVIDVAWLREAVSGGYKDTRIKTVETTVEGGQLSVAAQGPKHGGLGSSRYANDTNDASKAAFIVLPVSKANGNGDAPVAAVATGTNGTNGLASQGLQASNASQPAQHSDRFILTAANGFGVGPPPHIGTGSNSSSHIRGISNTSDVEMIDLDGHTEEGIKPLRRHGGIGESRWASSDPVSDAKSPGSPTPNNRPYWRTEKTWSLARYRSPASTKAPADGIAQPPSNRMQTIEEQPTRPDSLQSNNSITKHGGLGSSRYA